MWPEMKEIKRKTIVPCKKCHSYPCMCDFLKVCEDLKLKFTSGNSIPVERATITRKEWDIIYRELKKRYHI